MGCVRPGIFADCIPNRHLTRIKQNNSTTNTIVTKGRCHSSEQVVTYTGCHVDMFILKFDPKRSLKHSCHHGGTNVFAREFGFGVHPFTNEHILSIFVICLEECTNFPIREVGQTTWSETNLHNIYWKCSENSKILLSVTD